MPQNLLILGGTTEASSLAHLISKTNLKATISYAGRVERISQQPIPKRIGGFGGATGLASYILAERITHLVDATHPFAAQMSENAIAASKMTGIPLIALTRLPWQPKAGDNWHQVSDITHAVSFLSQEPLRVMLAIGRMHLAAFYDNQQHFYLLRLVDLPKTPPLFSNQIIEVARGPFTAAQDAALLSHHKINLIVAKNAGGSGSYAKIEAARQLGIHVLMIKRPVIRNRQELYNLGHVIDWLG
ncbi:cobalt-precorrin-6A reductase [Alphaproteobacteria bacterium]|nr:cobalt-precorrin-6A reductase [Alphaproteobacteria bacterium]